MDNSINRMKAKLFELNYHSKKQQTRLNIVKIDLIGDSHSTNKYGRKKLERWCNEIFVFSYEQMTWKVFISLCFIRLE